MNSLKVRMKFTSYNNISNRSTTSQRKAIVQFSSAVFHPHDYDEKSVGHHRPRLGVGHLSCGHDLPSRREVEFHGRGCHQELLDDLHPLLGQRLRVLRRQREGTAPPTSGCVDGSPRQRRLALGTGEAGLHPREHLFPLPFVPHLPRLQHHHRRDLLVFGPRERLRSGSRLDSNPDLRLE